MNNLDSFLAARRNFTMDSKSWKRTDGSPEWFHDRFIGGNFYDAPDGSFEICEAITSESSCNGQVSDEFYIALLINSIDGVSRKVEVDCGAGKYLRPTQPGTITFGDGYTTHIYQGSGPFHTIYMYFSKQVLLDRMEQILGRKPPSLEPLVSRSLRDPVMQAAIERLMVICQRNLPGQSINETQTLFETLCRRLLHIQGTRIPELHEQSLISNRTVKRVVDYLHANLNKDFQMDSLALETGISRGHLSRLFRQTMGIPMKSYLLKMRVEKAKEIILIEKDISLTDVAERCGFYDSAHLSHEFRRFFGVTPSKLRREPKSA
jgi:Transcriptional regulator containing an amidase domain and an AraC-type DNA-binding HTH domain